MKKIAFIPSADHLEDRIAMSGGVHFVHGLPVLTGKALHTTFVQIEKAFTTFATKGENYRLLNFNLTKAVNRVPYNVRDGLVSEITDPDSGAGADLQSNLAGGVPLSVIFEAQNTEAEVTAFVQGEVEDGVFLYSPG